MKYFTNTQIQEALTVLRPYSVFFSTTFLVLKQAQVPVGSTTGFGLDAATREFLNQHFRVHPGSEHFLRVDRQTRRDQDWSSPKYASTSLQSINTQTFREALLHERNRNSWGWHEDYVRRLASKLPRNSQKLPLFHLAVWLYKYEPWDDDVVRVDVVDRIMDDYEISTDELSALFEMSPYSQIPDQQVFQPQPVSWHQILESFSRPPDVPAENSGVLRHLETAFLGPTLRTVFAPAKRMNLITGDNGLGKTFLLDLAWWALTRDWVDLRPTPLDPTPGRTPSIQFLVEGGVSSRPVVAEYVGGDWQLASDESGLPCLVVYARVDGSFAIWDPANRTSPQSPLSRGSGIKFTREEVWEGKQGQIEGLIRDLVRWQQRPDLYPGFEVFQAVLNQVYPPDLGPLALAKPVRIPYDPREIPTFKHPYGDVPIPFESAGIRRIITLAYLLVWVWEEHKVHAHHQGRPEERQMVVLIDEAEAHLHPRWQRVFLPGLLGVAQKLHNEMSAQWIVSTHAPLVMASTEGVWDPNVDRLFHISIDPEGQVVFRQREYERRGPIDSWLSSDLFEIQHPGSSERERVIREAIALQMKDDPDENAVLRATNQLRQHLAPEDPFWTRWIFFADSYGVV
ncbi:MAG: AAA family ATPase [Chloroflexota bacterium]|nr:AAA family ATPase [Chloroflexota bacterium]MDE2958626.1 AAA family ATPase [Chloroflexota bacterium]